MLNKINGNTKLSLEIRKLLINLRELKYSTLYLI